MSADLFEPFRLGNLTLYNSFNSVSDADPHAHFEYFIGQLSPRGLARVHVLEGDMTTKTD